MPDILFICGFMGAGKSTIGKRAAHALKLGFLDLDEVIEKSAGKSISRIFEQHGEEGFRSLEREQLLATVRNYKGVLSLGGGALQDQRLVDHIKINGLLIFIETPFSVIFQRVVENKNRPLLLNEEGSIKSEEVLKKELNRLYQNRLKYYQQAEITIRTDKGSSVEETTAALVRKIKNHVSHS